MKSLQHHLRRLAARLLEAETVTSRKDAGRVLRKAEKHRRKIERLHEALDPMERSVRE